VRSHAKSLKWASEFEINSTSERIKCVETMGNQHQLVLFTLISTKFRFIRYKVEIKAEVTFWVNLFYGKDNPELELRLYPLNSENVALNSAILRSASIFRRWTFSAPDCGSMKYPALLFTFPRTISFVAGEIVCAMAGVQEKRNVLPIHAVGRRGRTEWCRV